MTAHLTQIDKTFDSVSGFKVGAVDAGLYAHFGKAARPDLTLIAADGPCVAAGIFTTNLVKAAPVLYDQARLKANPDRIRAVLINTASANACTGAQGQRNAEQTAAWAAQALGCAPDEVLVMSTGVIGTQLPMGQMQTEIAAAASALRPDAWPDAARAIMTTDTKPKLVSLSANGMTVAGIAKGAGMIAPNMATLLAAIVTDVIIAPALLDGSLREAAEPTFNRIVVDGDMSTNDTLLALASGAGGVVIREDNRAEFDLFKSLLGGVCASLARQIVMDAEGATKFIELHIVGADSAAQARQIGNAIATSPLVKTAFYGGDANWGRILAAAGRSGVEIDPDRLALWYDTLQLVGAGTPLDYDEARANQIAAQPEVRVQLDLGQGDAAAVIWTCDLSHDYVSINGHYRT